MTTSRTPLKAAVLGLACLLAAPLAAAQPQTLFADDFETPSDNWASMPGLWHVAEAGDCGAPSAAVTYNDPATCSYDMGAPHSGLLVSKPFFLSGSPPYTFQFDYTVDFDNADVNLSDQATVSIVRAIPPSAIFLGSWKADNEVTAPATHTTTLSSGWEGAWVTLQWSFKASGSHDAALGMSIDNITVTNSGGWEDLGHGLAGVSGVPPLSLGGSLQSGSNTSMTLLNGHPDSSALVVVGLDRIDAPFKGGVLVPNPDLLIPLTTNFAGLIYANFSFPAGVPSGTALVVQCWVQDPTNPLGWSASDAQMATTP